MRAIPKALLIHTITLHKKENEDRWGNGNLDTGITIQHVRMEPSSKIIRDKNNAEIQLSATLFYDCRNSLLVLVYKSGQEKLNNLCYQVKEQRR